MRARPLVEKMLGVVSLSAKPFNDVPSHPHIRREAQGGALLSGSIRASIWSNKTGDVTMYNVTFDRSYEDKEGWKSSQSFGRDDLLLLAKVADLAHSKIVELQKEEREVE